MSRKKEKILKRIEKLKKEWIWLQNRLIINEYEQRILSHSLLEVKDRPDVSFKTDKVLIKKRGCLEKYETRTYRCWIEKYTDEATGKTVSIQRQKLIRINGFAVNDLGEIISKPDFL